MHLYPIMYPGWYGVIKDTGKILGKYQKSIACLFQGNLETIFINHREWTDLGQFVLKKIIKNPEWGFRLNNRIQKASDNLVHFSHNKIFQANLKKLSNQQLRLLYKNYLDKQSQVYNPSLIPVYLDLYKPHLTNYLVEYLDGQIKKIKFSQTAKECFAHLTILEKLSKVQLEEIALLKIASQIKNKKFTKKELTQETLKRFNNHCSKFKYLGYNWEGPALPDSYFWKRLKDMAIDQQKPSQQINKIYREKQSARKNQTQLIRALKIDSKHQKLLAVTKGFIYSKDYRKMSLVQSYYEVEPLIKEIAKRVNLKLNEVRSCLLSEIEKLLMGELARPKDLTKRIKECIYIVVDRKLPGKVLVDQSKEAVKKLLLKKEDLTEVNYFHGQTACLGKATGTVKIINTIKDLPKMKSGDILVSQMTNPNLVPAMKKAAAIVTDLGGVTCHAAIISRELKIPCVIGTKIATKVLKDGDRVEVDANRGEVRKI